MPHELYWFWTTGRFDASWVQASSNIALVLLSGVTLVFLVRYVIDTNRLAKSSEATLKQMQDAANRATAAQYAVAYDQFLTLQTNLNSILHALVNDRFEKLIIQVCPSQWPELGITVGMCAPEALRPWIGLGATLRVLDVTIRNYIEARTQEEKAEHFAAFQSSLTDALSETTELSGKLLTIDTVHNSLA